MSCKFFVNGDKTIFTKFCTHIITISEKPIGYAKISIGDQANISHSLLQNYYTNLHEIL